MGKLLAINISKERGTEKREVPQAELVADYGIMGDAHAGKWHRQVSLLSAEKIDDFRARGAQIDNGAFGENLIISGFDLGNLPLGTRFCIGDTILEMTQIGKQCHSHCAIYKRMGECIMPKEGVFAVVVRGGQIHAGDEVKLIPAIFLHSVLPDNGTAAYPVLPLRSAHRLKKHQVKHWPPDFLCCLSHPVPQVCGNCRKL